MKRKEKEYEKANFFSYWFLIPKKEMKLNLYYSTKKKIYLKIFFFFHILIYIYIFIIKNKNK